MNFIQNTRCSFRASFITLISSTLLLVACSADDGATKVVNGPGGGGGAVPTVNLTAKLLHHGLLAIADAKNRDVHVEYGLRCPRRPLAGYAVGATGKNDRFGCKCSQKRVVDHLVWVNFAIDIQFA